MNYVFFYADHFSIGLQWQRAHVCLHTCTNGKRVVSSNIDICILRKSFLMLANEIYSIIDNN